MTRPPVSRLWLLAGNREQVASDRQPVAFRDQNLGGPQNLSRRISARPTAITPIKTIEVVPTPQPHHTGAFTSCKQPPMGAMDRTFITGYGLLVQDFSGRERHT